MRNLREQIVEKARTAWEDAMIDRKHLAVLLRWWGCLLS
jgi:hypothetical protein